MVDYLLQIFLSWFNAHCSATLRYTQRKGNLVSNWIIEKDGYLFRAVNGSFRSSAFTSASQAGLFIQRRAGDEAHVNAAIKYLKHSLDRLTTPAGPDA
jgi:hypothetical protein